LGGGNEKWLRKAKGAAVQQIVIIIKGVKWKKIVSIFSAHLPFVERPIQALLAKADMRAINDDTAGPACEQLKLFQNKISAPNASSTAKRKDKNLRDQSIPQPFKPAAVILNQCVTTLSHKGFASVRRGNKGGTRGDAMSRQLYVHIFRQQRSRGLRAARKIMICNRPPSHII
jgi:hypothetical protein